MTEDILNEVPISMRELQEELKKIKKRDKELNFRANKTEEYLNQVSVSKNANEVYEKIMKLGIPRLREIHVKKIIDLMPKSVKDLKMVLQGYTLTINNDNAKKIVDVIVKTAD